MMFKYDDDDTLIQLDNAISKVNKRALPDIQGSLRSYGYNEEEIKQSMDAKLDVISGFMIIDDDCRFVAQ